MDEYFNKNELLMEKNYVYKIKINEYLYIEILYDGKDVHLVSLGNVPSDLISLINTKRMAFIKIKGVPKCSIDLTNGKIVTNLGVIPTAEIRNYSMLCRRNMDSADYEENQDTFDQGVSSSIRNGTDLHTHFMEVLSGEQYLKILLKYLDWVGIDENGYLCDTYEPLKDDPRELDYSKVDRWISKKELLTNTELFDLLASQLSLPTNKTMEFIEINRTLKRRTALLELAGQNMAKKEIDALDNPDIRMIDNEAKQLRSDIKTDIYLDMIIESLNTLKKLGVKYVEFSFSNQSTIKKIYNRLKDYKIEGIKFNFLLSENRNARVSQFRTHYYDFSEKQWKTNRKSIEKLLSSLIKEGYIMGFDLMGLEQEIAKVDYVNDNVIGMGLFNKLEPVLLVLNSFKNDNLVCRLHAGEIAHPFRSNDGKSNPEKILEIVEMIADKNKITIPPPQIRIGHGLHIVKNQHYLDLLKKFKVTVEINASSNFALGNIRDLHRIPYNWYTSNGIPVVLGTDGGGFYLTTPTDESDIAQMFGGRETAEQIHKDDAQELEKRGL